MVYHIGRRMRKRFTEIERLAREQVLTPAELPDGATVAVLLAKGVRFW